MASKRHKNSTVATAFATKIGIAIIVLYTCVGFLLDKCDIMHVSKLRKFILTEYSPHKPLQTMKQATYQRIEINNIYEQTTSKAIQSPEFVKGHLNWARQNMQYSNQIGLFLENSSVAWDP